MTIRTSQTDPLHIAGLSTPGGGRLGLTFCPGKVDRHAQTGAWDRDLDTDLTAITDWGATALVTLMEDFELRALQVADLGQRAQAHGLAWYELPIRDVTIPDAAFERRWHSAGPALRRRLRAGESLVIHCRGGLGRTGTIAARLLIELGETPRRALDRVRALRPHAVETREQERYVLGPGFPLPPVDR